MEAKFHRQKALTEARRAMVLAAARTVFMQSGLERASIREIAKKAGYTPGAIYAYFPGKQHILSALLLETVDQLAERVELARPPKGGTGSLLHARAGAWIGFLASQSRDLELTLHILCNGVAQGRDEPVARELHVRLRESLDPVVHALVEEGLPQAAAVGLREALLAHGLGLLLVGRTSDGTVADATAEALFMQYIDRLLSGYTDRSEPEAEPVAAVAQPDLFG